MLTAVVKIPTSCQQCQLKMCAAIAGHRGSYYDILKCLNLTHCGARECKNLAQCRAWQFFDDDRVEYGQRLFGSFSKLCADGLSFEVVEGRGVHLYVKYPEIVRRDGYIQI